MDIAWIDGSSVKLGCIGFSKKQGHRSGKGKWRSNNYGSPKAESICKEANSKARLVEIYNEKQVRFLMTKNVRTQVLTKIGIDTWKAKDWWIGAELKSGTWYWVHSNKQITYWSRIGGNGYSTTSIYPYGYMYLGKTQAIFRQTFYANISSICQIK